MPVQFEEKEDEIAAPQMPLHQQSKRFQIMRKKRLSIASRAVDRGNKGYLDSLERAVRNFDRDGDGIYDMEEVFAIVESLQEEKEHKYCLKKGLRSTVCFVLLMFAVVIALFITMIQLNKEISPNASGELVNIKTGDLLSTHARGVRLSLTMSMGQLQGGSTGGIKRGSGVRNLQEGECESSPNLFAEIDKPNFENNWKYVLDGGETHFEFFSGKSQRFIIIDATNVQKTVFDNYDRYTGLKDKTTSNVISGPTVYYAFYCYSDRSKCHVYKTRAPTIVVHTVDKSATFSVNSDFPSNNIQIILGLDTHITSQKIYTSNVGSTKTGSDCTGYVSVSDLTPDTQYFYKLLIDGVELKSDYIQTFKTYPNDNAISSNDQFSFLVFADAADATNYNSFSTYHSAGKENTLFALQIGDFDHSKPKTLNQHRAMHRNVRSTKYEQGRQLAANILSKMSFWHTWNDHDYCAGSSVKCPQSRAADASRAFDEYYPNYPYGDLTDGKYYSFRAGDAEIVMLDTQTHRDRNNELLGSKQYEWLKSTLLRSNAKWKFIVSSITANKGLSSQDIDSWSNYEDETNLLRGFLQTFNYDNGSVIMISGDLHTSGAIDNGCNNLFSIPELSVATSNLRSINGIGASTTGDSSSNAIATVGKWSEGVDAGNPGYSVIQINSNDITIVNKDSDGEVLHTFTIDPTDYNISC